MSNLPSHYQGNESIIIAELDGSPIVMGNTINATVQTKKGPMQMSELPVLAKIDGISEEAIEAIADIVGSWHQGTGVPIMPITKESIMQALMPGQN